MESHYSDFDDFRQWVGTGHAPRQTAPKNPPRHKQHLWFNHNPGKETRPAALFRSSGYLDRHLELSEEQKNMILELTSKVISAFLNLANLSASNCARNIAIYRHKSAAPLHRNKRASLIISPISGSIKNPVAPRPSPHRSVRRHHHEKPAPPARTPHRAVEQSGRSLPDLKNANPLALSANARSANACRQNNWKPSPLRSSSVSAGAKKPRCSGECSLAYLRCSSLLSKAAAGCTKPASSAIPPWRHGLSPWVTSPWRHGQDPDC